MEGRDLEKISKNSKFFQISRNAQKLSQKCLNMVWASFWGDFLEKKIFDQYTMEGHDLEKLGKKRKLLNITKMPKNVPKTCLEHVLNCFCRQIFFDQFPMEGRYLEKISKNSKFFQKSRNDQKRPQNNLNMFWRFFSENVFAQCTMGARGLEKFRKILFFNIPKWW